VSVKWHGFLVFETDRAGFKNVAGLFFGEFAALYAIGIVCQLDLRFVIQPTFSPRLLFFLEIC
jgi:hypothetical protein